MIELKEIVGYLPYGLKCQYKRYIDDERIVVDLTVSDLSFLIEKDEFKLHLRPLSELEMFTHILSIGGRGICNRMTNLKEYLSYNDVEVLLSNHFDIHNLINRGLAIDINTIDTCRK